ncbi:hypothetical protein [Bordetella genomosp. 13]|uniref:hypothetical protein n=1 Tax=Bordetella genomosp. 13 TaxID=463040 RepID=UPI0011A49331|nr:hypothetical protein [Bordetella genomosp. 13]
MEILGYLGYGAIGLGVIFVVAALYAQSALSGLLDYFREQPALLDRTGFISDLYFVFDLPKCRYGFARYLYRHPVPPPEIAARFPDYARLRAISNAVFALHIGMGAYLAALFVSSLLAHRM